MCRVKLEVEPRKKCPQLPIADQSFHETLVVLGDATREKAYGWLKSG
jgi:hypothetical protein